MMVSTRAFAAPRNMAAPGARPRGSAQRPSRRHKIAPTLDHTCRAQAARPDRAAFRIGSARAIALSPRCQAPARNHIWHSRFLVCRTRPVGTGFRLRRWYHRQQRKCRPTLRVRQWPGLQPRPTAERTQRIEPRQFATNHCALYSEINARWTMPRSSPRLITLNNASAASATMIQICIV